MPDVTTLALTRYQFNCLKTAVAIAIERLSDAEIARDTGHGVLTAVNKAQDLLGVEYGYRCNDARTERIDELWQKFWEQTDVDFSDWFSGKKGACEADVDDPKGWPQFRDKGLVS